MNNRKAAARQEWVLDPPMDFSAPYALGNYEESRLSNIMGKYVSRQGNLERAWTRICHHLPESLEAGEQLECLEFATAHGAMLEIWKALGHTVKGTDFHFPDERRASRPWKDTLIAEARARSHGNTMAADIAGWAYQPIIESIGVDVEMVDGRKWPYPFDDKSADIVCCYQAIDAFGEPEQWTEIVGEFCRIARKIVLVGYNPLPVGQHAIEERAQAARAAWLALSNFNAYGLRTVFTELDKTRRGLHPVAMKFVAT